MIGVDLARGKDITVFNKVYKFPQYFTKKECGMYMHKYAEEDGYIIVNIIELQGLDYQTYMCQMRKDKDNDSKIKINR
jgi:hypothetical protein